MKNRTWLLLFLCAAAVCAAGFFFLPRPAGGDTVLIVQNGAVLERIDLSSVEETYTVTVHWEGRENEIVVSPGSICVCCAECADQICVNHGPLEHGGAPIICLPNRLIIKWAADQQADAVA